MPKQVRQDLSYFTLDCNIFDRKSELRPLLRKFKSDGLAVYVHILCDVYGTGYYFKPSDYEGYILDLAEDCGITSEKVQLIIAFMADRTLRDKPLLDAFSLNKNTVFTSHGIQKRYAQAMKGRKRSIAEIKGDYWLLTEEEEVKINTFYKSHPSEDKSENNDDKSKNNDDKSEIYNTTEQNLNNSKPIKESKEEIYKKESSNYENFDPDSTEPPMRKDGSYDFDYFEKHRSHKSIMDEFQITGYYRKTLEEFLRYCYANGHTVMNQTLVNLICRLDEYYGQDDVEKIKSLERAMQNGYYDIKELKR